jgi:tetratricopeptide (TPR) repeat protein
MTFRFVRGTIRGAVVAFVLFIPVAAKGATRAVTIPGLGTATFPTSTRVADAQQDFMRGLLLLHVFEYSDAAESFRAAEQADPAFAMAYWGEAMTFNHPVWNEVDVRAGQAALAKFAPTPEARAARIASPRERAYMSALEILYSGEGSKAERDGRYADAMQKLSENYPADNEAKLFFALALLGRSEGVRDVPTYLEAAAIAKSVFEHNPNHPGAAHYWIHGMDDPQHAAGALVAARALSKITPDAGHAQHMCSHIFLALGMWDDVVRANVAATSVVNRQAEAAGKPPRHCGHYNYWLEYGFIEQGRIADAEKVLTGCHEDALAAQMTAANRVAIDPDGTRAGSFIAMHNTFLLNAAPASLQVASLSVNLDGALMPQFSDAYGRGLAAAEAGDVATAEAQLAHLNAQLPQLPALFDADGIPPGNPDREVPQIQSLQLKAALLAAQGHIDDAVAAARQAAELGKNLAYAFGPPYPGKPSSELLGELLLRQNKPAEARAAFVAALQRMPNRAQTLLGLARAESAMGDRAAAAKSYAILLKIWSTADSSYAPRQEALAFVASYSSAKR